MTDSATLYLLLPETLLVAAATIIYLMGAFYPRLFRPNFVVAKAGSLGRRIRRLAAVDHRGLDARRNRLRSRVALPGAGAGLDPYLHRPLSRPARCLGAGGDGKILLPEHPFLGLAAVWIQL